MMYLILKIIHVLAVILWVGSLFIVSYITSKSAMSKVQMSLVIRITEASIGITWLAGIVLVIMGGWYASTWWQIKIVLVLFISAIHTFTIRRWKRASSEGASTHAAVPLLIIALTLLVIILVVLKRPI